METNKKSFVRGAAVLSAAGLLVKAVGVFYRIPLNDIIGTSGMALYQKAYPIYAWLLVLSTAGMPTAIARLVSERVSRGDARGARRVFTVAMWLLLAVGAITSVGLFLMRDLVAKWVGEPLSSPAFAAIAPALFFVAALSAYRGYFQGLNNMTPTAVSQVVEQVGKIALGLYLASRLIDKGIAYGAAGALIGVTLSEVMGWVMLMGLYHRHRHDYRVSSGISVESANSVIRQLFTLAIPIILGASILPLINAVDSAIVQNRLMDIGYTWSEALDLFGVQSGLVMPVVNMPTIISQSLSVSLVPVVTASWVMGYKKDVRRKVNLGMKLALLVALPSAAGMMVLATPIMDLFYGGELRDHGYLHLAGNLLTLASLGVVFLAVVQTMTGVLNGMGKVFIPAINLAVGAVFKIVISLVFLGMPSVNIYGAPIGTVTCYMVAAVLDYYMVARLTGSGFPMVDYIVKPLLATGIMAAAVWGFARFAGPQMGSWMVIPAIVVGAAVFLAAALLVRAMTADELRAFPGGNRLARALTRLRLLPSGGEGDQ